MKHGEHNGISYIIIDSEKYTCAYVEADENARDIINKHCHGGVTYSGLGIPNVDGTKSYHWIGWDYCHVGDREYTIDEVEKEVKTVIDKVFERCLEQLADYMEKNKGLTGYWDRYLNV